VPSKGEIGSLQGPDLEILRREHTVAITTRFAVAAVVVAAFVGVPSAAQGADAPPGQAQKLRNAITVSALQAHEQALQKIATLNNNTRASGTPGYDASVDYVVSKLEAAGYDPTVQEFTFPFFQELAPSTLERVSPNPAVFVNGTDFATMTYSGSGDVTANVQEVNNNLFPPGPVDGSSPGGCAPADFAGFVPGNIALIQRGTCNFGVKAANAQAAGASAVLIFNEGQPGRTGPIAGTAGTPDFSIPILGTTYAFGLETHNLLANGPVTMHVTTSTLSEFRQTANVLADTPGGDPNRVVVQGSHLDSRIEGPGINDNGSGSTYNLESAIQIAKKNIKPRNKIRFAWWGAEELNLLGSTHYVNSLSDAEFAKILLNLNFDMIASPNFVRFVYDGDGSAGGPVGPAGSAQIEQVLVNYFTSQGLASDPTPFNGRSDYGPFIARGAPAGGLFTGAEGIKTPEQAAVYGGVAGVAYDPCYHQACDDINNLNYTAFKQMSDAAATALVTFAFTKQAVTATTATVRRVTVSRKQAARRMARAPYRGSDLQR
jgi:Zn-dependent M28 family amino/carboxypeptidase